MCFCRIEPWAIAECWYWPVTQKLQIVEEVSVQDNTLFPILRFRTEEPIVRCEHPLVMAILLIKGLDRRQLMYTRVFWQVEEGLVSKSDAEECVTSEFNPVRAGFYGGTDVWTRDVLNLGVRPDKIIEKVSQIHGMSSVCYQTWVWRAMPLLKAGCCIRLTWPRLIASLKPFRMCLGGENLYTIHLRSMEKR